MHSRRTLRTILRAITCTACLLAGLDGRDVGAAVTQVTATPDFLYVKGDVTAGRALLLERRPWQAAAMLHTNGSPQVLHGPAQFEVAIPRFDAGWDRLYSAFQCAAVETGDALTPEGGPIHASVLRGISSSTQPFPEARSKKGLQVQMVDDALKLGIGHAALNFNFGSALASATTPGALPWSSGGRTYHFQPGYFQAMDSQVKPLSDAGVVVSLILLSYAGGDAALNRALIHPAYDPACPNRLGAFNTVTEEGVRTFIAMVEFIADRYSREGYPHGRVVNFILGNEVNSHWFWSNRGRCTMEEFAADYLKALRLAHAAIRKASVSARVYVSLEHHWNIHYPGGDERQTFAGRPFLDHLHRRGVEEGDFDWHLAFHPYPEDLFKPRTWLDASATDSADSPRITFKNLHRLVKFVSAPGRRYDPVPNESYGRRTRRIILSEQGFHASDTPEGELWQAAGYAYAYRKVATTPEVDSFILHRHVDHAHEGGLNLGLWTRKAGSVADPDRPRRMYGVFQKADTREWEAAFEFALPVIGITRWSELKPGGTPR